MTHGGFGLIAELRLVTTLSLPWLYKAGDLLASMYYFNNDLVYWKMLERNYLSCQAMLLSVIAGKSRVRTVSI